MEPAAAIALIRQAVREESGAGPVVLLGHGRWAEAALGSSRTYAAIGTLGPSRPEFHPGSAEAVPAARWEPRARQICVALGWAQGAGATPVQPIAAGAAVEPLCREGLLLRPQAVATLR